MNITRARRAAAAVVGATAILGSFPALASAAAPSTVTITSPTAGATVGGSTQTVTVSAPLGTQLGPAFCTEVDAAPIVPATWGTQASDGTITGTLDLTHCANGANTLSVYYSTGTDSGTTTAVPVTMANPGVLTNVTTTTPTFTPNGDKVTDTDAVLGTYVQADSITVQVLDRRGHVVRTLTTETWLERMGIRSFEATWDGRDDRGRLVKPGRYTYRVVATTSAGSSAPMTAPVTIVRARTPRGAQQASVPNGAPAATFYNPTTSGTTFDETLVLQNAGQPALAVTDASGTVVATPTLISMQYRDVYTLRWDGTLADGTRATPGQYVITATLDNGFVAKLPVTLTD